MAKVEIDKGTRCRCKNEREFFFNFMRILTPMHGMTKRQSQLAAEFLTLRHELSKSVTDKELLNELCTNVEAKKKCRERLNINENLFNVMWRMMKSHGFIVDKKINNKYIPDFKGNFLLGILFTIDSDEHKETT